MCRALRVRSSPLLQCPVSTITCSPTSTAETHRNQRKTQVMSRRGGQAAGSPGASKCFAHLAAGDHMTDYYAIVMQLLKSRRTVGPPFGQLKSLSEA